MMLNLKIIKMKYKNNASNLNHGISDQGAIALSRALKHLTNIEQLDLQAHRISTKGAIALVRCIHGTGRTQLINIKGEKKKNTRLENVPKNSRCRLQLNGNPTIGEGVIVPISISMYWKGSSNALRIKLIQQFGIFDMKMGEEIDEDAMEFRWKVRQNIQQKRKVPRLKHL